MSFLFHLYSKNSSNILRKSIEDYRAVCENIVIHEGVINPSKFTNDVDISWLILYDDLYDELCSSVTMNKFFTFSARKTQTSVIVISQNPYAPSRFGITIRRQMSYIIVFPSKMDQHPIGGGLMSYCDFFLKYYS